MPIEEYEKYRQYLFSFALWPEKSGHFFIYRRLYLSGIWTPLVRASLRFYGQWQV